MHPSSPPRDEQIAQLKKQIAIFKALQFIMPGLMLVMAAGIGHGLGGIPSDTRQFAIAILCVFAVADFALLRFMILPVAQKRLAELEGGNTEL